MTKSLAICNLLACSMALHSIESNFSGLSNEYILDRHRRQLLFPNQTVMQLNIGISTPTPDKRIAANWAFQANFNLPWNTTQIPWVDLTKTPIVSSRRKRDEDTDPSGPIVDYGGEGRLHLLYKYLEEVVNGFGHNGKECLLKALCQLAAEPFDTENENVLQEIASFLSNPNNDEHDDIFRELEAVPYIDAHNTGESNKDCQLIYASCPVSLVDLFSYLQ